MKAHHDRETSRFRKSRTDLIGAALLVAIGLFTVWEGSTYSIGILSRMGPGFFPVALGVILTLLGVLLAVTADDKGADEEEEEATKLKTDWRSLLCVVVGMVAFAVLGHYFGLVVATFALVFISALGDRTQTVAGAGLLALGVCVVGTIIFSYFLELQFPLFRWGW